MRLPNDDRAVVDIRKLLEYCLSTTHRRGRHKARVFQAALGVQALDAEALRTALLQAARSSDTVTPGEQDVHGRRYTLDFTWTWMDRQATLRSAWIIRPDEDFPRLTSCYVL